MIILQRLDTNEHIFTSSTSTERNCLGTTEHAAQVKHTMVSNFETTSKQSNAIIQTERTPTSSGMVGNTGMVGNIVACF